MLNNRPGQENDHLSFYRLFVDPVDPKIYLDGKTKTLGFGLLGTFAARAPITRDH